MMKIVYGTPASSGIVIGEAFVQTGDRLTVSVQHIRPARVSAEQERFQKALSFTKEEIIATRDSTFLALGKNFADIFETQLQILLDPKLSGEMNVRIEHSLLTAESAVTDVMEEHVGKLLAIDCSYVAEKVGDLRDIEVRLLRHLVGSTKERLGSLSTPVILFAASLTPGQTIRLNRDFVKALVTEKGGLGSHTAILAQAMDIPCVVGVQSLLTDVMDGDTVIVDAKSGTVIIRPDEATIAKYQKFIEIDLSHHVQLASMRDVEAVTSDGIAVELLANIEFPHEAANCLQCGAVGIGLFRTEFLYLLDSSDSSEEDHFQAYKSTLEVMQHRPVTIRTMDLGDDKTSEYEQHNTETNPALGLRGVRFAMKHWNLFRCQLRAILRASVFGDLRIMFPMISSVLEFKQVCNLLLNEIKEELRDEKIPFNENIKVGMMVEVPAAVVMLDRFVEDADFFSIGTNDLTQYTLAVDRSNRAVAPIFNAEDPAVLRLIRQTIQVGKEHGVPVSLCGQMGGDPYGAILLLGLGLRSISCAPTTVPLIKQVVRSVPMTDCESIANDAMRLVNASDIKMLVKTRVNRLLPGLLSHE